MGLLAYLKTQFVVHLLIGFVFVVSGLVINFTQLCTLALWPINKQLYRRLNCRLAYSLWSRECPPALSSRGPRSFWPLCPSLRLGLRSRAGVA